jgi:hypothetical protein
MLSAFFSILVVAALVSILSEIAMRIRVTKVEARDKIAWWRRSGDVVASDYEKLFPGSGLPFLRRFGFWFIVACAVVVVLSMLIRKSH